jgi:hypothetical protein
MPWRSCISCHGIIIINTKFALWGWPLAGHRDGDKAVPGDTLNWGYMDPQILQLLRHSHHHRNVFSWRAIKSDVTSMTSPEGARVDQRYLCRPFENPGITLHPSDR